MVQPINPQLGFNIFHAVENLSDPALTIVLDDVEYNMGSKKVRFNGLPYTFIPSNNSQWVLTQAAIIRALERGFQVHFTLTMNTVHAAATQNNYIVDMLAASEDVASWAEGLDWGSFPEGAFLILGVGNEEEDNIASNYGGAGNLTAAKTLFRTDARTVMATAMKAIYTHGSLEYTTFDSECDEWVTEIQTNGWGDLDAMTMNVYRNSAYIMESARSQAVFNFVVEMNSHGYDRFGKRRTRLTEVQSFGDGLNDICWIKGNESLAEYDIIRRYKLLANRYPNVEYFYFAYDVSSTNWDFKIRSAGAKQGEFRRYRQFFANKCSIAPMTDKKLFLMEQLIANPFANESTLDVFSWQTENGASRVVQTSGGAVNNGRFMRITSTTNGNSDVFTSASFSGGMAIPKHMVGIPILLAFWAKYDPADIPTLTGEASVTLATSVGTHQIPVGSNNFTPTADWQRFYYIFKVTQACNVTLRLWGKKQFTAAKGTVDYDNMLMTPMFNDLMLNQILNLHLTEALNTGSPLAHYEQEPTGSTYVEAMRWMPDPVRID